MRRILVSYRATAAVAVILASLVAITFWQLRVQSKRAMVRSMVDHVEDIRDTLRAIDEACEIIEVAHTRSYIDFLSVEKFAGSRVGPLKLKKPEAWQGPYSSKIPLAQGKMFELVRMKDGYGIVPGAGVKLPNGKMIGVDIVFDAGSDIDTYLTAEAGLEFEGKPLIAKFIPRAEEPRFALTPMKEASKKTEQSS